MPNSYHVVHFIDEDGLCDIIHTNWLLTNSTSLWPTNAKERRHALHSGSTSNNCVTVNIRILYSTDDYLTASNKLKFYVEGAATSDMQSDLDMEKQKQQSRERRRKKEIYESESDEDWPRKKKLQFPTFSDEPLSKVRKSFNKTLCSESVNTTVDADIISKYSVQKEDRNNNIFTISDKNENRPIRCLTASVKTNLFTPSEPTSVLDVNNNSDLGDDSSVVCQNETSPTNLQGSSNVNGHKTKDFDFNYSLKQLIEKLILQQEDSKHMLEKLLIKQEYLHDELKDMRKSLAIALGTDNVDSEVISLITIRTKEEFLVIQEILGDDKERKKLVQWLTNKCGKNRDAVVENCLLELIHNEFSTICNFTGANGKLKVDGSWIVKIIQEILFRIGLTMTKKRIKNFSSAILEENL